MSLYHGHGHLDLSNSFQNSSMIKTLLYKDKPGESVKDGLPKWEIIGKVLAKKPLQELRNKSKGSKLRHQL